MKKNKETVVHESGPFSLHDIVCLISYVIWMEQIQKSSILTKSQTFCKVIWYYTVIFNHPEKYKIS